MDIPCEFIPHTSTFVIQLVHLLDWYQISKLGAPLIREHICAIYEVPAISLRGAPNLLI